jgi:benzoyl-CoA reductase/2-hydroxyglutaryl-CoA dehydratase subunit BcrC/BadD/HgdB
VKNIIYVCPFVPAEWIAAHSMRPSRLLLASAPRASSAGVPSGFCPFARAFVSRALAESEAAGIVVTTVCDQMRRAAEVIARDSDAPVFLMNVPSTWETATAQKIYLAELERLGGFLVRLGGNAPDRQVLAEVMMEYDTRRAAVREARGRLSPRDYSERIARFHAEGLDSPFPQGAVSPKRGIPLALLGGPLFVDHFSIFDLIEAAGGTVVLDATETGERTLPAPFDRRRVHDYPLMELAEAYFGSIPDVFRRPNSELYRYLKKEIAVRAVRGIILRRYVWCDGWHAEVHRLREWAGVPVLDLDIGDDDSEERTSSRIEAFLAMLK